MANKYFNERKNFGKKLSAQAEENLNQSLDEGLNEKLDKCIRGIFMMAFSPRIGIHFSFFARDWESLLKKINAIINILCASNILSAKQDATK